MYITARSKLTADDVQRAAFKARREHGQDIYVEELATSPRGAITVYCESYSGKRRTNRRRDNGTLAASWTAWGYFIAELFKLKPDAQIGQYKGAENFRAQCRSLHDARAKYVRATGGVNPYADISFLELLES